MPERSHNCATRRTSANTAKSGCRQGLKPWGVYLRGRGTSLGGVRPKCTVLDDDGILAIGSGGSYALAAARMLIKHSDLPARGIVEESLHVAADICVYTNDNISIEEL